MSRELVTPGGRITDDPGAWSAEPLDASFLERLPLIKRLAADHIAPEDTAVEGVDVRGDIRSTASYGIGFDDVLPEASDVRVSSGKILSRGSVLQESSDIELYARAVQAGDFLDRSTSVDAAMNRIAANSIGWNADNLSLSADTISDGDRYGSRLLKYADRSRVHADTVKMKDILLNAENSYLLSDTLIADRIGEDASNTVIAARTIQQYEEDTPSFAGFELPDRFRSFDPYDELTTDAVVFTADDLPGAVQFDGEWGELEAYIKERVPFGYFELASFDLPRHMADRYTSVEDLDEDVSRLHDIDTVVRERPEEYPAYEDDLTRLIAEETGESPETVATLFEPAYEDVAASIIQATNRITDISFADGKLDLAIHGRLMNGLEDGEASFSRLAAQEILENATDTQISADKLSATHNIARKAENVTIETDSIEAERIGYGADRIELVADRIGGETRALLPSSTNAEVTANVIEAERILTWAEDAELTADTLHGEQLYERASRSHADLSTLQGRDVLRFATGTGIATETGVIGDAMIGAENTYLVADTLDVAGNLGRTSRGSVVAAQQLQDTGYQGWAETIDDELYLIVPDEIDVRDHDRVIRFNGDWDELADILRTHVPDGVFQTDLTFRDRFETVDDLRGELDAIGQIQNQFEGYRMEQDQERAMIAYRENESLFREMLEQEYGATFLEQIAVIDGVYEGGWTAFFDAYRDEPAALHEELAVMELLTDNSLSRYDREKQIDAAAATYNDHRAFIDAVRDEAYGDYLIRIASKIEDTANMAPEAFVDMFDGGAPEELVFGDGFETTIYPQNDGSTTTDASAASEDYYRQGVEKLESIARGEGKIDVDVPGDELSAMAGEVLDEDLYDAVSAETPGKLLSQVGQQIGDAYKTGNQERGREIEGQKNTLKQELDRLQRKTALEQAGVPYTEEPDYSDLDAATVRNALDQLAQEFLTNCSAEHEAERIADNIVVETGETATYVHLEGWDKDLTTLPSQERSLPCTFPGGMSQYEHNFTGYMADHATQVVKLETDAGTGNALINLVEHNNAPYLLVHSVESDDSITSDKRVSHAIKHGLDEYAETVMDDPDAPDVQGMLYSMGRHNNAAESFQRVLEEDSSYVQAAVPVYKQGREDLHYDIQFDGETAVDVAYDETLAGIRHTEQIRA